MAMTTTSTQMFDFGFGPIAAHQHENGKGWVANTALVSNNAYIDSNALVYGYARVYGDAWVYGDARVYGDAWVYGDADFFLAVPLGSRVSFLTIHADAKLGIRFSTGCFSGSEYQFKEAIQKTHGDNEYATQYRAAIDLALMCVKPAKIEE